jgi:hypothetical protein
MKLISMNKIIYSFIIVICIGINANAQIKKGSILLGGQVSYYNSKSDNSFNLQPDQKTTSGNFIISAGKAFKENSVFGIAIGYSSFSNKNNSVNPFKQDNNYYNISVFYRKYKSLGNGFSFFAEGGISYNNNKQKNDDSLHLNSYEQTQSGIGFYLTPGISYQVCKKLQLEILIPNIVYANYSVTKSHSTSQPNPPQSSKTNSFSFNTSLSPSSSLGAFGVGFRFIL